MSQKIKTPNSENGSDGGQRWNGHASPEELPQQQKWGKKIDDKVKRETLATKKNYNNNKHTIQI